MNGQVTSASNVSAEFEGANLGDARRNKRLIRIVQALVRRPEVGFPQAMPAVSELEAFYRFVESDRIDFDALLAPHARAAAERMQSHPEMVIVHDTTEFRFTTQRDDLGRLRKDSERAKKGFLTHFALALSADEARDYALRQTQSRHGLRRRFGVRASTLGPGRAGGSSKGG
jgi:hypothetical protein